MRAICLLETKNGSNEKRRHTTLIPETKHNKTQNYILLFFSSKRFSNGFAKEDYEKN